MNDITSRQIEVEVDIKELIWDILEQWKAVLIAAFLMAVLVAGAKYAKDMNEYSAVQSKKEAEKKNTASVEERIEDVLAALPEGERETVATVINQNDWIETQKEYINDSILLNTDPTNQRTLVVDYYISTAEDSDTVRSSLIYGYSALLRNKEVVRNIGKAIAPKAKDSYIAELITVENSNAEASAQNTDAVMEIRIVLPDDADAAAVEEVLTSELQGFSATLSDKISPHRLSLLDVSETYIYNTDAVENRTNILYSINTLQNNTKSMQATLSDGQKAAIEAITAIKTADKEASAIETGKEGSVEAEEKKPGISKKYALLGFVLGVMLYAFIYLIWVIRRGRINCAGDLEYYTQSRLLGEAYHQTEHKGIDALFHSKLVDRYRYRGKLDEDVQIQKAATKLDTVCKHAGIKSVSLLCTSELTEEKRRLVDAIKSRGLDVHVTETKKQTSDEYLLSLKDAVILAGRDIKATELISMAAQLKDYDVEQIGSIYYSCI